MRLNPKMHRIIGLFSLLDGEALLRPVITFFAASTDQTQRCRRRRRRNKTQL